MDANHELINISSKTYRNSLKDHDLFFNTLNEDNITNKLMKKENLSPK